MSTKLRVLLDECCDGPLGNMIRSDLSGAFSHFEYISADHELANRGILDPKVIAYAADNDLVTVTVEYGIDHRKYAICTHPGIVVIHTSSRHPSEQFKAFKSFVQSGSRTMCKHAVVKLYDAVVTVVNERGGPIIENRWADL